MRSVKRDDQSVVQVFLTLIEGNGSQITDYEAYQQRRPGYNPVKSGYSDSVKLIATGPSYEYESEDTIGDESKQSSPLKIHR